MTADPHAASTLAQLQATSRALASRVRGAMGLEAGDLLSAGWLGYVSAAAQGKQHAGCLARARGAMLDTMRGWDGAMVHRAGYWELLQPVEMPDLVEVDAPPKRQRLPRRVERALRQLPPKERTALWHWTVRGWDHDLIAEHLRITTTASGGLRFRALARLRAAVGGSPDRR